MARVTLEPSPPSPNGALRILLVGADEAVERNLLRMLCDADLGPPQITCAPTLTGAMESLNADVALVVGEPEQRCKDMVRELRSVAPQLVIVVVCGPESPSAKSTLLVSGAQDYLPDGVLDASSLTHSIRHAIERGKLLEQHLAFMKQCPGAVVVVSPEKSVLFANSAAQNLLQGSGGSGKLVGSRFGFDLECGNVNEVTICGDTARRYAELRVMEIEWQRGPAFLAMFKDTTDRHNATELHGRLVAAERLSSIGQLAAGMTHEINNPATFAQANLELMGENLWQLEQRLSESVNSGQLCFKDPSEHSRCLEALSQLRQLGSDSLTGLRRIIAIAQDFKNFARGDNGQAETVDASDIVTTACSLTTFELRYRAKLETALEKTPPLVGDRSKLCQVVTNLLINAAHAIGDGDPKNNTIRATTRYTRGQVYICVEDTGPGIPKEAQAHVFDPFFTTKPRGVGTGLGLSLSAEIVRQHGGELTFKTMVGKGTTFQIALPPADDSTARNRSSVLPNEFAKPRTEVKPARVLLIDDEPMLLTALTRWLRKHHEVVTAMGGEEGLRALKTQGPFDVVLCDLMMPGVDGKSVYEHVSREHPDQLKRFVLMSGGAPTPSAKAFIETVAVPVLDKPVPIKDLLGTIAETVLAAA